MVKLTKVTPGSLFTREGRWLRDSADGATTKRSYGPKESKARTEEALQVRWEGARSTRTRDRRAPDLLGGGGPPRSRCFGARPNLVELETLHPEMVIQIRSARGRAPRRLQKKRVSMLLPGCKILIGIPSGIWSFHAR